MGAPRYLKVYLMSMICSVAVLATTYSEPYVAVSTVACILEYQSTGVLLTKWKHPVKDLPVGKQWFKLASQSTGVLLTKWRHPVEDLPVGKQWFKIASMVVVVITA